MALEPVHVMVRDRVTRHARLQKINPTRKYLAQGVPAVYVQNGRFLDEGGHELDELPANAAWNGLSLEDHLEKFPIRTAKLDGPDVIERCPECGDEWNASQMNAHLLEHIRAKNERLATYERPEPEPEPAPSPPAPPEEPPPVAARGLRRRSAVA